MSDSKKRSTMREELTFLTEKESHMFFDELPGNTIEKIAINDPKLFIQYTVDFNNPTLQKILDKVQNNSDAWHFINHEITCRNTNNIIHRKPRRVRNRKTYRYRSIEKYLYETCLPA